MLNSIMQRREDRESGFTLIELLVVVAIIAILAVIAIPLFNNFRDNAANSAAEAELKNAATAIEAYYTAEGSYPASSADAGTLANVRFSDNVQAVYAYDGTAKTYTLNACNIDTKVDFVYDSTTGTITESGTPCAGTAGFTG